MRCASGILLSFFIASAASAGDSFDSGLKNARENEATDEWRVYSGPFFEKLGPILRNAMQQCFPPSKDQGGDTFTILFAIQADGTLTQLMARPETTSTACVLKGIEKARVPAPPRPGWWEFLEMKVTP